MTNTASPTGRFYYRCLRCCHIVVVEGQISTEVHCVCDGKLALLGRVGRKPGLTRDGERCACDGRCTNALGPSCDCSCGGVNHGTGRTVPVEIDAGGIPRLLVEDAAACLCRAAEYQRAMEPLRAALRVMRKARADNPFARASCAENALVDVINGVAALRTHKGRITAVAKLTH